jgi:hypothetical protein
VAHRKANGALRMERVRVSCGHAAHLASITVAFQDNRSCFF